MKINYIPVLSAEQMMLCDSYTIEQLNIPSQTLMERAAEGTAEVLLSDGRFDAKQVLILAGGGNNGGDGIAIARILHTKGIDARVCFVGDETKKSVECARQYGLAITEGVSFVSVYDVLSDVSSFSCVVDAIFGIGLKREIIGEIRDIILAVNSSGLPVLSVDIPSGINADCGKTCGVAIKADVTVCIQALKSGLLLFPGAEYAGEICVVDIGVYLSPVRGKEAMRLLSNDRLPILLARSRQSNKGSYGKVLFVCGSRGMSGAAYLCASAALRSGIGLAHVFTHDDNRIILQAQLPQAIMSTYGSDDVSGAKFALNSALSGACVAVIGCGLGRSKLSYALLERALNFEQDKIMVLDADALNILADSPELWLTKRFTDKEKHVTVITPHPAEFARLTHKTVAEVLSDIPHHAKKFAAERGVWVVLKDAHTVIASPDGECYVNPHANSGMSKGGSGDVLAGMIGAMLAKLPRDAENSTVSAHVAAAVLLHSLAGEAARDKFGEVSMLPTDVIASIIEITKDFSDTRTKIEYK